jgi:uncharacterized BrkB/YihY/UPF0761 family membrane protein
MKLRKQTDYALYAAVLLCLYGLILLLLVQLKELKGSSSWVGTALAVGWVGLLVVLFVWARWLLTHKRISRRDLLPEAVLTGLGLVVLMIISSYVMGFWVDLYARDYGGFGVVLAIISGSRSARRSSSGRRAFLRSSRSGATSVGSAPHDHALRRL